MKLRYIVSLYAIAVVFAAGCATSNIQVTAFKTITAIDATADAAYGGYIVAANKGLVSTNDIPKISGLLRQLHSDCAFVALTAEAGTNALATPNLQVELSALTTAIANTK